MIADIVSQGATVNIPPFLGQMQLNQEEVIATKNVAQCRIHVERAIGRLKMFKILECLEKNLRPHADKIVQLIAVLCNFQSPLIKEGKFEIREDHDYI